MPNLTKQLADSVTTVGVHSAYGDPVEIEGTTIIPVATTWYGFGAGEGGAGGQGGEGEGEGGGGGGMSIPVGAYVTRDGYTRFEPNTIALLAVGVPFVCVAGRALARVVRALKK
ncbi:MAG: spore germination protein GerW family protein [Leucobacter sp.]